MLELALIDWKCRINTANQFPVKWGSEEKVEKLLFFVDYLKGELPVSEFFDGLLHIFLTETLNRNQRLAGLFRTLFRVLNRNNVGFLETVRYQLVNYVFLVGQFDQVTVLVPL